MTEPTASKLGPTASSLTLRDALAEAAPILAKAGTATGLVYTPTECFFVQVDPAGAATRVIHEDDEVTAGRPATAKVAVAPLDDAFEARCFSPAGELRWLQTEAGPGIAVLFESPTARPPAAPDQAPLGLTYLLWGEGTGRGVDGWSELYEARIGSLWVPLNVEAKQRAHLVAHEIVKFDDDGNAYVADEILHELRQGDAPAARARPSPERSK